MARLNAKWDNFWNRGQTWYHFWTDSFSTPTVALDIPSDVATGQSLTPALLFTGTDREADTIEYELQLDPANTFDSSTIEVLVDSYPTSNFSINFAMNNDVSNNADGVYQTFTSVQTTLKSCKLYLAKSGTIVGTITAKLYNTVDGFTPNGAAIATSDSISSDSLTTTKVLTEFTFSGVNRVSLGNGTMYGIALEYSGTEITEYVIVGMDITSPANPFHCSVRYDDIYFGYDWHQFGSPLELIYYIYGTLPAPLIDKFSLTDSGFTAGHPFASNAQITYTIPSSLSEGTPYYWRVRGKDSGTKRWGAWSTIFSFTTLSSNAIKTWNGLARASIKTYNGLAIALVKTINGLT